MYYAQRNDRPIIFKITLNLELKIIFVFDNVNRSSPTNGKFLSKVLDTSLAKAKAKAKAFYKLLKYSSNISPSISARDQWETSIGFAKHQGKVSMSDHDEKTVKFRSAFLEKKTM